MTHYVVSVLLRDVQRVRVGVADKNNEAQHFDCSELPPEDHSHKPGKANRDADHGQRHEQGQAQVDPSCHHGHDERRGNPYSDGVDCAFDNGVLRLPNCGE